MSGIVDHLHLKPVPDEWDPVFFTARKKPSAVLVLLVLEYPTANEGDVVLIRRSSRVGSHRGQMGFPGGRFEDGDVGVADTALREAQEEIDLDPSKVRILGVLPSLLAIDGSMVFPVVGMILAENFDPQANPAEVQGIFKVPYDCVAASNRQKFSFNMFGCWRDSFLYDCGEFNVWGLSAEILASADLR